LCTIAGFALFKVNNEGKLKKPENIYEDFATVEAAKKAFV
jgi:hypothetical protein